MNDSAIIRQLKTLYNCPISEIAGLSPEEVERDLIAFDDEQLRLGLPTLAFTADEANEAIDRVEADEYEQPRHSYVDDYHV